MRAALALLLLAACGAAPFTTPPGFVRYAALATLRPVDMQSDWFANEKGLQ